MLVAAPAAKVRERLGSWATVEEVDAARCRLLMKTDSLDWPAMAVGSLDADFQVVSPPAFAALLTAWGERFTRCAASGPDHRAESDG